MSEPEADNSARDARDDLISAEVAADHLTNADKRRRSWAEIAQTLAASSMFVGRQDALAALDGLLVGDTACETVVAQLLRQR